MSFSDKIIDLANTTRLSNAQIAKKLGCSKRTVRRYAGPYAKRLDRIFGITPEQVQVSQPKILIFDIETSMLEVYVWSLRQHGWINPENIIKDWSVLCWSAKWLFDDVVISRRVRWDEAFNRTDSSIVNDMWNLLNEADIVIAHNGARFDVRRMNARFILNGLKPTLPYKIIDTLRIAKRQFEFSSYKLDYINGLFGLDQKTDTDFDLWKYAVSGDKYDSEISLEMLSKYCENDVRILEELYVHIRPWIKGHPNLGLYIDTDGEQCTNCGSTNLSWTGKYYTVVGRYRSFRCLSCGAVGRSRYSDLSTEERERICHSVA